ncbi:MAG: hypothetical protein D6815_11445 [Candidatus Dadabacteria bacterium]|nr:MAG: hypothetical protein D6815_11445 [Candidatus Dadabacteria bacterium]
MVRVGLGAPPHFERVRGLHLPQRLTAREWIPQLEKPCDPRHPLILVVARVSDSRLEAARQLKIARRVGAASNMCVALVSPDSPAQVRRWVGKQRFELPIGAGASWARRFDRHKGTDLYLWLPERHALYALRGGRRGTSATAPATDAEQRVLIDALAALAAQDALEFRFATLRLLGRIMPFEHYRQLVDRLARGTPPASASADAVARGLWWQRLRWTLAQADPTLDAQALRHYAQEALAPSLPAEVHDPAVATADSLPADDLATHYSAATAQDDPVTLSIRSVIIRALQRRPPQDVEAVVRAVALDEHNPWLRNRLLTRYLYDVRPQTAEQLAFLRQWRAQLPYYDIAAAKIDSYLDAIQHGQDPFQPLGTRQQEHPAP